MLVLSRKPAGSIVIGSDVHVTVLSVSGQHVKLGIRAPAHVRIVRSELLAEPVRKAGLDGAVLAADGSPQPLLTGTPSMPR